MWLIITLILSVLINIGLGYALYVFLRRLFQYDDLYQYLVDDIEINLKQFDRMRGSSLLSDDDEVRNAHKNMMVMSARLDEFATQIEETTGLKLRKKTQPMKPINVTKAAEELEKNG